MNPQWIHNISRSALQHLAKNLQIQKYTTNNSQEIIDKIFTLYKLYEIQGHNNLSFKIFVGEKDVIIFEINQNGKYSVYDFSIPSLTINNYDGFVSLDGLVIIKQKEDLYLINNYMAKV